MCCLTLTPCPRLIFQVTNEKLPNIVAGLDPRPSDRILAVCGSGDQAFALLEYAFSVHAVDYHEDAIAYAQRRHQSLQQRYEGGFYIGVVDPFSNRPSEHTIGYFSQEGRLATIAAKAERLSFEVGDIFDSVSPRFTKIYLSNAFSWLSSAEGDQSPFAICLRQLMRQASAGAVIYVADETPALQQYNFPSWFQRHQGLTDHARSGLHEVDGLSSLLKQSLVWAPVVYEKK